jgi:hypothetical protein
MHLILKFLLLVYGTEGSLVLCHNFILLCFCENSNRSNVSAQFSYRLLKYCSSSIRKKDFIVLVNDLTSCDINIVYADMGPY